MAQDSFYWNSLPHEIIEQRIQAHGRKKAQMVILVCGGSYNPVHLEHIRMLQLALECAQVSRYKHPIMAFMLPSTDKHVVRKVGRNQAYPLQTRIEMCNIACRNEPLISVIPWGMASASNAGRILERIIKKFVNGAKVKAMSVIGADIAPRYNLDPKFHMIVTRPTYTEEVLPILEKKLGRKNFRKLMIAGSSKSGGTTRNVSSTMIRQYIQNGDFEGLLESCSMNPECVYYLQQYHMRNRNLNTFTQAVEAQN